MHNSDQTFFDSDMLEFKIFLLKFHLMVKYYYQIYNAVIIFKSFGKNFIKKYQVYLN